MALIPFNRANNPPSHEVVHIKSDAVQFVEATPVDPVGQTQIQVFGQTGKSVRIVESVPQVLAMLLGSIATHRHHQTGAPPKGSHVVHVFADNIATIVPNMPHDPSSWTITFKGLFS